MEGFSDSDYATDRNKRRPVTGYVFEVGGNTTTRKHKFNDGGIPREFVVKKVYEELARKHVLSLLVRRDAYFLANSS